MTNGDRFLSIFENMQNAFQIIDGDLRYVYVNKRCEELSKYPSGFLIGKTLKEAYPNIEESEIYQQILKVIQTQKIETSYSSFTFPDGNTTYFFNTIQPFEKGVCIFTSNISKQLKNNNIALRESVQWLKTMTNEVPCAIFQYRLHPGGKNYFPFASKNIWDIYEMTPEDVLNDASSVLSRFHPDDHQRIVQSILKSAETLETWEETYRVVLPTKGERIINGKAKPERLDDQSVLWHGYIHDFTDIFQTKKQLETKNKALERFNYVVSHDLQEPINSVMSMTKLLERDYEKLSEIGKRSLDSIEKASSRMRHSVASLLELSRVGKRSKKEPINFAEIMADLKNDLSHLITKKEAEIIVVSEDLDFEAYKDDFYKLIQNIIVNGIKYTPEDRTPKLITKIKDRKDCFEFSITDNGIGIDEKYYDVIFEPFQRLHHNKSYSGSGIGLAHCKKVVELHNGDIWVESEPNKGTTFYFTIEK